jgi:mono/diheme cytochrome c family protein
MLTKQCLWLALAAMVFLSHASGARAATREQIESDWLKQAQVWYVAKGPGRASGTTPSWADAAGAVDGIKDGKYGFHTGGEPNPWWQVDLGTVQPLGRIIVYNRLDYAPGLHNADNMIILTSADGKQWTKRYDCAGRHFGGVSDGKPLVVDFPGQAVCGRFVRMQVPSPQGILFHLDEVEVYGVGDLKTNIALHRPADQSSTSQWSVSKISATPPHKYPTKEITRLGRRLAIELKRKGVDTRAGEQELDAVTAELRQLANTARDEKHRQAYLRERWAVRRLALANPLLNFEQLLIVKRFTQETMPDVCLNHMPWVSRPGGDICVLSGWKGEGLPQVRPLLAGALGPGHVHGADLWWDGSRVVFGYARSKSEQPVKGFPQRLGHEARLTTEPIHIFEIGIDGRGLRQLTESDIWSDLDPTYLPSGDVAFVSDRCECSLQCNEMDKDETSCNLYVMHGDGSRIRRLSVSKDGDYMPHTLNDGTIAYTRWEYLERDWANVQSLWFIRPDGTGADALFKQHFNDPWSLEDVCPIPGSAKLACIAAGHHTLAVGPLVIIDHHQGINEPSGIGIVTPGVLPPEGGMSGQPVPEGGVAVHGGFFATPGALSETTFLVSYNYGGETDPTGYAIYLVDVFGTQELLYRDASISSWRPVPLRPRPRPPILPDNTDLSKSYAVCSLANVAQGVPGVDPKSIRYLRLSEGVQWPYGKKYGGQRYEPDAKCTNINWTPVRVLGTVPIEPDGSAHFRVPADTAVYFQLLDANQMELRRMRSFISFQPGETRSCTGCHESRAAAPHQATRTFPMASAREPSILTPPPWGDWPVSFLRDIQPILNRHCVGCHSGLRPAAGLDLYGGLTPGYNRAFESISARNLVQRSNVHDDARVTMPLAFGSHKSRLVEVLKSGSCSKRAKLSSDDWLRLVTWIDTNAPYHDGFINKRQHPQPYDLPQDRQLRGQIAAIHARRCASCHSAEEVTRIDWIDLARPERSLFLTAPLAKAAGGNGKCAKVVYANRSDPDYVAVERLVHGAVRKAWALPRRDLQALAPPQMEGK